jgi:Zn-dependent protease
MYYVIYYLARILAVLFIFSPHEFAHAWVAYKNGDPTAKIQGRMTLNPIKHFDPIGFVMTVLIGFGWAKPVPINPYNFRNYKKGMFTTAIAGVTVNYIIAFFAYLLYCVLTAFVVTDIIAIVYAVTFLKTFLYILFQYSLCIVVFNLLPLYPLDGFRIVEAFTREVNPVQRFLRNYGNMILIVLVVESFLCNVLSNYVSWAQNFNILNYVLNFATNIIGFPILKAWGWILTI